MNFYNGIYLCTLSDKIQSISSILKASPGITALLTSITMDNFAHS